MVYELLVNFQQVFEKIVESRRKLIITLLSKTLLNRKSQRLKGPGGRRNRKGVSHVLYMYLLRVECEFRASSKGRLNTSSTALWRNHDTERQHCSVTHPILITNLVLR